MSSRTYLSIGDVLTLLREEFPDVTISKIRFLESQGLVNPERSPSGYREFFEPDVERLRWVLRQQREHFLPLKVIRDRLADGELDDLPPNGSNGKPAEPAGRHAAPSTPEDEQATKADEEAMARILADASRRSALDARNGPGPPRVAGRGRGGGRRRGAAASPDGTDLRICTGRGAGDPAAGAGAGAGSGPNRPEVAASASTTKVAAADRADATRGEGGGASRPSGSPRQPRLRRSARMGRRPGHPRPTPRRHGAAVSRRRRVPRARRAWRRPRPRPAW